MSRRERINEAIRDIRDFYELGRQAGPKRHLAESYGLKLAEQDAQKRGTTADTIRKARLCADGYTPEQFMELCRLIRTVQSGQDDGKAIFGKTHLIQLLSVHPKKRRRAFQREVIENGWSSAEMDAEIKKRFGTRRQGGRKLRLPSDTAGLLVKLDGMCESWRRLAEGLRVSVEEEGSASVVPKGIQKQFRTATEALASLHKVVTKELQVLYPERETRRTSPSPKKGTGLASWLRKMQRENFIKV